jgi:cyclic di-GMP phosphodiesterase
MENIKSNYIGKTPRNRLQDSEKSYTENEIHNLDTQARLLYAELITISRKIISGIDSSYINIYEEAHTVTSKTIDMLKSNPFLLKHLKYSTTDNYLYAHTTNTTLLSLAIGIAMNLKNQELLTLGISALLHDIGMTQFISLTRKERKLNSPEINLIRNHSFLGVKKLDKIIDFNYGDKEEIEKIILQIHERHDGTGYPKGIASNEINILASIISAVDSYEAMTHIRSWRDRLSCHSIIKDFIENRPTAFNPLVLKKLIEVLSVFPPGSLVELSNGTIAQVLKINKGSLLRPMVKTILDKDYNPVEEQIIDLVQYPLTSIDDIVTLKNLTEQNPTFAAELELSLLWIEW